MTSAIVNAKTRKERNREREIRSEVQDNFQYIHFYWCWLFYWFIIFWFYYLIEQWTHCAVVILSLSFISVVDVWRVPMGSRTLTAAAAHHLPTSSSSIIEANVMLIISDSLWLLLDILNSKKGSNIHFDFFSGGILHRIGTKKKNRQTSQVRKCICCLF